MQASPRLRRSDDETLRSLQDVVQDQARVIQSLQASLTALESKVQSQQSAINSLQVRENHESNAVAFSVRFQSDDESNGVLLGQHQTLTFNDVITNIGNGYDSATGIFTAPVAGVYIFFLRVMSTNSHGSIDVVIDKQGAPLDLIFAEGQTDPYDQGSGQVTTHLAVGEKVWARQQSGEAVRGRWYTSFTGLLLNPKTVSHSFSSLSSLPCHSTT
ncbi:hypothetical protein C0Q70_01502 [Pomacea canaliculata]|uniref:C1q domain-containing protein n=1 Tax=Pomacea canaliculata TaxID=400727 RepID=A0A2T7PZQ9_POMCA|nr:hypothetical protein C0Q70_01502 [Pomacea canaliculata]